MTDKHPGRPPLGVRRVNVSLDEHTIEIAKSFGNGNLSEGLRQLATLGKSYGEMMTDNDQEIHFGDKTIRLSRFVLRPENR